MWMMSQTSRIRDGRTLSDAAWQGLYAVNNTLSSRETVDTITVSRA